MEEENINNIWIQNFIQYFTDDLGYPRENLHYTSFFRKEQDRLNFLIYIYGKPFFLIKALKEPNIELLKTTQELRFKADLQNILYYIVTNGIEHYCYETKSNKLLENIPSYEELNKIQPIHKEIFNFLESARVIDKNLTYKLRKSNNNNRLDKGYWFLGNDNYLVISFWAGTDWKNRTPNIYLTCEPSGKFSLVFTSKDSKIKTNFLQNLASILPGFKQGKSRGEKIPYWEKILAKPSDAKSFIKILDEFIETDKKIIDTFITNELELKKKQLDGIDFIPEEAFLKNLRRIRVFQTRSLVDFGISKNKSNTENKQQEEKIFLKNLQLQNIGHFRNLTLDLNHRVICLLGENGIGKSTILRAILLSLIGVDETSEIEVERKELQQLLRITGESKGTPIFVPKGRILLKYDYGKSYTNQVDFEKIEGESEVRIYDAVDTNEDAFGATKGNYLNNLVIGFSQVQSREKIDKDSNLNLIKKAHVKDILPLLYDEADNRFQQLSEWIIRLYAASNINTEKEGERKIIDFVFEVVGEIIGEGVVFEKVNHLDNLLWVKVNSNDAVPFHLISQGFKNVFAWIGHFMKRLAEANDYVIDFMNKPAILLIDEIDTYLHPKWQKNILRVLAEKFPNTQIIVTTHSPLVASHLPTENKAIYIIKENEVIPVKHIYGKEIASIFYQWMGVEERPKAIQDKIDLLFVELDKENMNAAKQLYNELKINLGENDEALVEAKNYMQLVEN